MQFQIISLSQVTGISKKSGNPFQILRATVLSNFEVFNTPNYQVEGVGLSAVEMQVSDAAFPQLQEEFSKAFKGQPVSLNLEISMTSRGITILGLEAKAGQQASKPSLFSKTGTDG